MENQKKKGLWLQIISIALVCIFVIGTCVGFISQLNAAQANYDNLKGEYDGLRTQYLGLAENYTRLYDYSQGLYINYTLCVNQAH